MKLLTRCTKFAVAATLFICIMNTIPVVFADGAATGADAAAPSGPYTIVFKFVAGKTIKYSESSDVKEQTSGSPVALGPQNIHFDVTATQKVISVDPATGAGTQQITLSNLAGTMNGQPMNLADSPLVKTPITMVTSPAGQMLSQKGAPDIPGLTGQSGVGSMTFLPTKPINVGDTWTASFPLVRIGENLSFRNTLSSVNVVNGERIAKIQSIVTSMPLAQAPNQTSTNPQMSGTMAGVLQTDFDIDAGVLQKTVGQLQMNMTTQLPQANAAAPAKMQINMDMNSTMVLLPDPATN